MFERRVEGRVPRKHHLIHRDDEGALLHEECFTREGFEGPYTILYHRNRPHAHKRAPGSGPTPRDSAPPSSQKAVG